MANKPGWSKPSTILFASEIPANERAFSYALAQAREFSADLILFHVYDTLVVASSETSGIQYYDYAAAARLEAKHLEPLAQRARDAGVQCEVVARPGLAADQILGYLREREIDRIVMGTHSPGPIGKMLVGSVAEAVLRTAGVPVFIIGPEVVDGAYRNFATRTVLSAVSLIESSCVVANFAAEVAAQHNARLILQHVIRPQDRFEVLANHTVDEIEADLLCMIPTELRELISIQTIVVPGDPTEELLYPESSAAGRSHCPRRAWGLGVRGRCSPGSGLQGARPTRIARLSRFHRRCWPRAASSITRANRPRAFWQGCFRTKLPATPIPGSWNPLKPRSLAQTTGRGAGWTHFRNRRAHPAVPVLSLSILLRVGLARLAAAHRADDSFAFFDRIDPVHRRNLHGLLRSGRPVISQAVPASAASPSPKCSRRSLAEM